jgi:hypothetical protein
MVAGARGQEREIQVGVKYVPGLPLEVLAQAKNTATRIYAGIGVKLNWSNAKNARIRMEIHTHTPNTDHPGVMGYALLYGDHAIGIHILLDRISDHPYLDHQYTTGVLLGHVMAHELGHVLEGFCRHSEDGVMKGHWDHELMLMQRQPLSFDPDDVELIRNGVARWQR